MPRYFFHIVDGATDFDDVGVELDDHDAVKREAVRSGAGLLADDPDLLLRDNELRINVTSENGSLSFAFPMLAVDGEQPVASAPANPR